MKKKTLNYHLGAGFWENDGFQKRKAWSQQAIMKIFLD